jgi:hypothetical protein
MVKMKTIFNSENDGNKEKEEAHSRLLEKLRSSKVWKLFKILQSKIDSNG